MKKIILSSFAWGVKQCPALAMKFTLKNRPYAVRFMLSGEKELRQLRKLSSDQVRKRLWSREARLYALQDEQLSLLFADDIRNAEEFDVFLANAELTVKEKKSFLIRIVKAKKYSLNDEQALKLCIEYDLIDIICESQPEKITPQLLEQCSGEILQKLVDRLLSFRKARPTEELLARQNAKRFSPKVISFLLKKYIVNDEVSSWNFEKLLHRLVKEKYFFTAEDIKLLSKAKLCALLREWIKIMPSRKITEVIRNSGKTVLGLFWDISHDYPSLAETIEGWASENDEVFQAKIAYLLENNQPLPSLLGYLRRLGEYDLYEKNVNLCRRNNLFNQIEKEEAAFWDYNHFAEYVLARAKSENFSAEELSLIQNNDLRRQVYSILEAKAQVHWLKNLMVQGNCIYSDDEEKLKNTKLSEEAQYLLFDNVLWLKTYIRYHRLADGAFKKLTAEVVHRPLLFHYYSQHGVTQEEYSMLLLSPNKDLAMTLKPGN